MVQHSELDGWSRLGPLALVEGSTTQAQVYSRLREALISGYFRPGQEISLRRAAAALCTGLTPVREALRQLESDGGLEVFGGNRVLRVPVLSEAELADIRDIRVKLEGLAALQAVAGIGPAQLRLISSACAVMQRAADTHHADLYLESNWRFHSLIYRAAARPVLMTVIEGMWLRVGPLIRLAVSAPHHFERSMESHWAAERALRDRDPDALKAAITHDISNAALDLGRTMLGHEQAMDGRH